MQISRVAWGSHYSTLAKALSIKTSSDIYDAIVSLCHLRGDHFKNQCDLIERVTKDWSSLASSDPKLSMFQKEAYDFVRSARGFENNYFLSDCLTKSLGIDNLNLFSYARPAHLEYLLQAASDRVSSSDRLSLALSSEVKNVFTCSRARDSGLSAKSLNVLDANATNGLNISELLALVDYTHAHTKTFGFINNCVRHHDRLPQAFLSSTAPVEKALRSGLAKLERRSEFLSEGVLYRGLALHPAHIDFLKQRTATGEITILPSLMSTTSQYSSVYSADRGKNTVLFFDGFKGAAVAPFHDERTENQNEVIISQNKPYRVTLHSVSEEHREAHEYIFTNSSGWLDFFVVKPAR